jgi:hypothetical protein
MKAKQIPITTGAACGTMVTRVESNSGKLLGFIRVVNVDWTPVLCGTTLYISQQCYTGDTLESSRFKTKACHTLLEAYLFLGVSSNELDNSDLGEYPYAEHTPSRYWKNHK